MSNTGEDMKKQDFHLLLVEIKNGTATLKDSLAVSYKTRCISPHDSATPCDSALPVVYPKKVTMCVHTKTCTWTFTAALFIAAETWKQARCPSTGKWINCSTSRQWNIIQYQKELILLILQRHREVLNAYSERKSLMKEYQSWKTTYDWFH